MDFQPVAYFRGAARWRSSAPRQGVFDPDSQGVLEFLSQRGYDQALRDLEGFERLWVVFQFHQNSHWRPTVRPPVPPVDRDRVGVFASRSPYRPNPIGLSCVRLLSVQGLNVEIAESDLLDGTPILDVKPYIPTADAFPNARAGWVETQAAEAWRVEFACRDALQWILEHGGVDLFRLASVQLAHNPLDASRKRVQILDGGLAVLACRTWRLHFRYDTAAHTIVVTEVRSGYSVEELTPGSGDRYHDKEVHREFCILFPSLL